VSGREFAIAGRRIGPGEPPYVIAELSANHGQHLDRALELVRLAAEAGADAVKLQTYTPDTITIASNKPWFRIASGTRWDGRTLHDLYAEAYTPWEWHAQLKAEADRLGVHLFSSPFDATAVELLEEIGVPAYKIASFEIVDLPLIRLVASKGKPMIISTGMATLAEIEEAVRAARDAGATQIALLKCTSSYPAPAEEANLRTIPHLADAFGVPVGLSDHTMGVAVPIAAVALGAVIVEKHMTRARADGGPDGAFSTEPDEFAAMVAGVRAAALAVGEVSYTPTEHEVGSRRLRRSLFVVADVGAGETFTVDNVRSIRPGDGLHTRHLEEVLGRRAAHDVSRGEPLRWDDVAGEPPTEG
jgi:N-acetylneuraminate synthase